MAEHDAPSLPIVALWRPIAASMVDRQIGVYRD
jgi:hypothetical protein